MGNHVNFSLMLSAFTLGDCNFFCNVLCTRINAKLIRKSVDKQCRLQRIINLHRRLQFCLKISFCYINNKNKNEHLRLLKIVRAYRTFQLYLVVLNICILHHIYAWADIHELIPAVDVGKIFICASKDDFINWQYTHMYCHIAARDICK